MDVYPPKLTSLITFFPSPLNSSLCPGCMLSSVSSVGTPISSEGMNSIIAWHIAIVTKNMGWNLLIGAMIKLVLMIDLLPLGK